MDATGDRQTHGFDVLADALLERNRDPIFGLLGDGNLAPIARAVELGATFIPSRHETAGLAMATGYALSTGRTTVVTTTRGPGVANAMTGLVSAARDRAPLVYLAGETGLGAAPNAQSLDQEAAVAPTGAAFLRVERADDLVSLTSMAFRRATVERRPIVLSVPVNFLHGEAVGQRPAEALTDTSSDVGPTWSAREVVEAWEMLRSAKRPVLLAGRGAVESAARDVLIRLADAAGALLISTLPVNGLFSGEPFDLGLCGGFCLVRTRELLDAADAVIAFGASLNRYTLSEGSLFTNAKLVHCDIDPAAIGRSRRADLGITGDARVIAEAILTEARRLPRDDGGYRTDEVRARIAETDLAKDVPERHAPEGVDPRGALRVIDRQLSPDRRVVVDVGHFSSFPCQIMPVKYPGQLLPAFGFGSVGLGLATGIGVSVAYPDQTVVVVVGDGGMLMSLGELDSVARAGRRMLIVVMNDAAYGAEVHHLRHHGLPTDVAEFARIDFHAVAKAFGIDGRSVRTKDDLVALEGLGSIEKPMLIDVRMNPAVVSDRFQRLAAPAPRV